MGINPETVSPKQLKAIAATRGCGIATLHAAMDFSDGLKIEDYLAARNVLRLRQYPNAARSDRRPLA